ncbi:MAG: M67 family metallopeptidase [Elusimicrobia bacterium]|nr:M67 family metallopeptidase [Elusimicrobiota bacterium]
MKIPKKIIGFIFAQGEKESPIESCGYLAGKKAQIFKHYPMRNSDLSSEHFSLDPKEQFNCIRQAREEGFDILAVYHTHPSTPARPSAEDIRLAYDPAIIYVICSLIPESKDIKAFRIIKGQVTEEFLIIEE